MFLKRCVFGDRFHRKLVDGRPHRRKKITAFKQKRIHVDGALRDRGFGRFHKGNSWIHFQSEQTQPSCMLRKDKGKLRSKRFRAI